jgi:hypothetical protein
LNHQFSARPPSCDPIQMTALQVSGSSPIIIIGYGRINGWLKVSELAADSRGALPCPALHCRKGRSLPVDRPHDVEPSQRGGGTTTTTRTIATGGAARFGVKPCTEDFGRMCVPRRRLDLVAVTHELNLQLR